MLGTPDTCLKITQVSNHENMLQLQVNVTQRHDLIINEESKEYAINESLSVKMKIIAAKPTAVLVPLDSNVTNRGQLDLVDIMVFFKFTKCRSFDKTLYSVCINSKSLNINEKTCVTDNDAWYLVHETEEKIVSFDVIFNVQIFKVCNPFQSLYDDTKLTDLKLVGDGGVSVEIHKAVLAAQSGVVKKMLEDKQLPDGILELKDIREDMLKHFKDYIYLQLLPDNDIEQLLLLASKYTMSDLEQSCIRKIISSSTANDVFRLTKFAQTHEITDLYLNILESIQKGVLKVKDIRRACIPDLGSIQTNASSTSGAKTKYFKLYSDMRLA